MVVLKPDSIVEPTGDCVVRKQASEHLIYNSRTDELHLLPATAFLVYQLCDGLHTVAEVESELAQALELKAEAVRQPFMKFLEDLIERGVLAVAHA